MIALATGSVKNGVISSVGAAIAFGAPPWLSGGRTGPTTGFLEQQMPVGRKVVPLVALALALTFPFYATDMFTIPVFGAFPSVETAVNMLVFIMMAVGLNIVVGYAGLLDLGYVAFYAVGAYSAAWFASLQFPTVTFHLGSVGIDKNLAGIHVDRLGAARPRRRPDGADRRHHRPADPPPPRRLPGDRHARLRRDHAPDRP